MPDIFAGTEPPAWLQRMTAQEPGMLGSIFGELVGGIADSAEIAIDTATKKQGRGINTNWIKELPNSIKPGLAEARLNVQNPLWKMQAQQAQLNMAEQGLRLQNEQTLIDSRKQKLRMQEHDQDVLPKWLQDHPTWESRQDADPPVLYTPEAIRMYRDVQLGDAGNVRQKAMNSAVSAYSKQVDQLSKLDATAAAPFAANIGKVVTPQMQQQLIDALGKAQAKSDAEKSVAKPVSDPDGNVVGFMVGGKFHTPVKPQAAPPTGAVTMKDEAGNVIGWTVGNKFVPKKEAKPVTPKFSDAQKSRLLYARERLQTIDKAMADPASVGNAKKMEELQKQRTEAVRMYNIVLNEAPDTDKPAAVAATGTKPTVTTQGQFDALPSGAVYVGQDGKTYRKP